MKGILTGYKNALFKSNTTVEAEAARRQKICDACPMLRLTKGVKRCGICGCPLSALTRQNNKVCKEWIK